jgi:cell division protein ZapE
MVDGPLARYRRLIESGAIRPDAAQLEAVEKLEQRFLDLSARPPGWLGKLRRRPADVRGLYLHGQVGRGKTMLMDLLAESLEAAASPVWRIHFHRFLDQVHARMHQLGHQRDPLKRIATEIAGRARVLCFDEFHVGDIGDAMILGELLKRLFENGVVLVTTSNTAPDQLYADGLQRARFLPAIEAIKTHCEVHELAAEEDFRLRELIRHPVYYYPDDAAALADLAAEFQALAAGERISSAALEIRGHQLQPLKRAGSVAWFDFATLCQGPRASGDYIELAQRFGTLILSEVPVLSNQDNDAARRFIHLVDECYDRAVKLIIAAAAPPEALYTGQRLAAPFQRTVSRLIEMQSRDYLGLPHKP